MPELIELAGQRFGMLVVRSMTRDAKTGRPMWQCVCDCGNEKTAKAIHLRKGITKSCGCLRQRSARENGLVNARRDPRRKNPLYHRLASAIQRCHNPKNPGYKNYGGRGIVVCDRWRADFDAFLADMGEPPASHYTLERIDNDGPYSPDNCRWASRKEQLRNQRRSILITAGGRQQHAKAWAEELGISYQAIGNRFRSGGIEAATEYVLRFM